MILDFCKMLKIITSVLHLLLYHFQMRKLFLDSLREIIKSQVSPTSAEPSKIRFVNLYKTPKYFVYTSYFCFKIHIR